MMLQRLFKNSFHLLALAFLFMSVACSHTQRKVAKLDELDQFDNSTVTELKDADKAAVTEKEADKQVPASSDSGPVSQNDFAVPEDGTLANPEIKENAVAQLRTESDFAVPAAEAAPTPEVAPEAVQEKPAEEAMVVAQASKAETLPTEETVKADFKSVEENTQAPENKSPEASKEKFEKKAAPADTSSVKKEAVVAAAAPAADSSVPSAKPVISKEALAADAMDAEEDKEVEMASANISSLIEKNLLWIAFAIVGGVIVAFLNVRRNRRSGTHT